MPFLRNHLLRKIILTIVLSWGCLSFYLTNNQNLVSTVLVIFISVLGLVSIWRETSAIFTLILLSFVSAYAFYTFFLQFDLPLWLLMVSVLIVFGYLFTYTEQKIGILSDKRLIYLVLFSLVILEIFLTLSYFLINPISQSLIIASICYLFVGFCYTVLAKHPGNSFSTYLVLTSVIIISVFLTSSWSTLALN
jgi:hypothetical protein